LFGSIACFGECCLALHIKWFYAIILESVKDVVLPLFDVHVQAVKNCDCAFLKVVQQNSKMATATCKRDKVCCIVTTQHPFGFNFVVLGARGNHHLDLHILFLERRWFDMSWFARAMNPSMKPCSH
jgi:hypothetical protein